MKLHNNPKMKKIIVSAALLGSISSQAAFLNIVNNAAGTINPEAEISGPIYRHETKAEDKYGDEVAKIILEEAHRRAKTYLEEGNTEAYYAFMVLALAVPRQESLYVQFSEVEADRDSCNDDLSEGKKIKNTKDFPTQDVFQHVFNAEKAPKIKKKGWFRNLFSDDDQGKGGKKDDAFLLPCKSISKKEDTYKRIMLGGWDGSDVGMMQVSVRWHYENYLKPKKFKSVRESVRYGIGYLKGTFDQAVSYHSSPEYIAIPNARFACFTDQNGNKDYKAIIQGTWAAYNGGGGSRCRFTKMDDPNNDYAGHDKGFLSSIKSVTDLNKGRFFGFNEEGQLPISEVTKNALAEIVNNYEQKTNNRQAIAQILGE